MKKIFSYIIVLMSAMLFVFQSANAQTDMGNIRKLKMEIVLNEMKLDPAVEKRFTPLYTKYSDETLVLKRKIKEIEDGGKPASDKLNERERLKQEILDIEKKYKTDFLKIISAKDLENMYKGETKFRETLLQLKNNK